MDTNQTPEGVPTNQPAPAAPPQPEVQAPAPAPAVVTQSAVAEPQQAPAAPEVQPVAPVPAQPAVAPVSVQPEVSGLPAQPVAPEAAHVPPSEMPKSTNKKSVKKLLIAIVAVMLLLAAGGGYYAFGYLPNTSENVWRRGLASIGVGLEELNNEQELFSAEGVEFDGEINITRPVEVNIKMDGTTGLVSTAGDFSLAADWEQYSPQLDLYYSLASANPQLYFQFDGVKEIVDDNFGAGSFNQIAGDRNLEGVWWLLDFEELVDRGLLSQGDLDELLSEASLEEQVTTEDYQKIVQSVIDASSDFMFTANVEDMVLQIEEDLGTEEFEGVESRKYAVSVNKDNLKKYIVAIRDNMIESGALDTLLPDVDIAEELSTSDIDEAVDELDFSDVKIEAWVGLNNKVLRNLRFSPTDEPGYIEMSLLLEDTNLTKIPMKMKVVLDDETSKGSFEMGLAIDLDQNTTDLTMAMDIVDTSEFGGTDIKMDAKLSYRDLAIEPKFEIPTPSESFLELIDELGGANSVLGATTDQFEL